MQEAIPTAFKVPYRIALRGSFSTVTLLVHNESHLPRLSLMGVSLSEGV